MGGREPAGVEGVFVRLRLLIKTSLCSDVPLPVLMRIKKPKSVCVVKDPKGVSLCMRVSGGVCVEMGWGLSLSVCRCIWLCVGVHARVHVCVHALLFVCKSTLAPSTRRGINSLWLREN